jgi:hypothetical protein
MPWEGLPSEALRLESARIDERKDEKCADHRQRYEYKT